MIGRSYYITMLPNLQQEIRKFNNANWLDISGEQIIVLVIADDHIHASLQSNPDWITLPSFIGNKPIGADISLILSKYNVVSTSTTSDVVNTLKLISPVMGSNSF